MSIEVSMPEGPIYISPTASKGKWRLVGPYEFTWSIDGVAGSITVPANFVFDGASIPRAFWSAIGHPLGTQSIYAALFHDYCFASQKVSFKTSAKLYKGFLLHCGMPKWKATAHYWAVRTPFAKAIYDANKKD